MTGAAFSISDARYAKGKKIVRVFDGIDGLKGRGACLAEALGGKWVHRSNGYTMSEAGARKFALLHRAGFDACYRVFRGDKPKLDGMGQKDLSVAQALKLVKE